MDWTGSTKAVFLLVVFLQLSSHQWTVKAAPLIICVDQELTITADSNLELYIDGVQVTNLQNPGFPGKADTTILRASAQVVAVKGQNEVIYGGFLGSSGTFVTDASWKCSDQCPDGWQGVGYDDSSWKQAYEVRLHGDSPWYRVEGIRLDARWIWIKPEGCIPDGIIDVCCRKNLVGTCDYPPTTASTEPPTTTTTTTTTTTPPPTTTTTTTPEPTTTTTTTTTPEPTTTTTTTTTPEPTTTTTTTTTPEPTTTTTTTTPEPTTTTTTTTPEPTTTTTTTTPEPTTTTTTTTTPEPTTTTTTTTTPEPTTTTTTTTTPIPTVPPTTATSTQAPLVCQPQPTPPPGTDCSGTGVNCTTDCVGLPDGDYQSCLGCRIYVTCSNEIPSANRPCPSCLVWDDKNKTCQFTSPTCTECPAKLCSGTGAACIGSCRRMADGDYQSCKGWDVYATCTKGRLYDEQPCPAGSGVARHQFEPGQETNSKKSQH